MWDVLSWLFFIIFIAGLIVAAGLLLRGYMTSGGGSISFKRSPFAAKADKRLNILEQATVDGRRKLVLIRRDNVEHLVMIGGPIDVVVESGIDTRQELRKASQSEPASVASRAPRTMGQATGS